MCIRDSGDTKTVFTYGDESRDMIITYNDATIEVVDPNGGDWIATEVATFTIVDPDANKNPTEADELEIGDETAVIPTIKMGNPLTLAGGEMLDTTDVIGADATPAIIVGHDNGSEKYSIGAYNTTDNSERLRIVHFAEDDGVGAATHTLSLIHI